MKKREEARTYKINGILLNAKDPVKIEGTVWMEEAGSKEWKENAGIRRKIIFMHTSI